MTTGNLRRGVATSVLLAAAGAALGPDPAAACACGCDIFDVGTASMFPAHAGGMVWVEYDFQDQNKNWSGTASAPPGDNSDKRIRTGFMNVGFQYQFNGSWGASVEVPYWERQFKTLDDDGVTIDKFNHSALGDIRLKAVYNGFSSDLSTGITFGLKLPTGDSSYASFDPDTEIGSGSTDTLIGAYHLGNITADGQWRYFAQVQWDQPIRHKADYRPGNEVIGVVGAYYEGWQVAPDVKLAPLLQVSASFRGHDGGPLGLPDQSGFTRVVFNPGIEADIRQVSVFFDVGFPVLVNVTGDQLVAPQLYRLNIGYHF